jgi:two-component system CheB/CheR fusion protein
MARSYPAQGGVKHLKHTETVVALREKIRRYELIFQATHDALYDLNLEDGTVEWNDALYTQYGYARHEPAGTLEWWAAHVHPDDAFMLENKITDLIASQTDTWQCEYRFQRADGGYNYVRDRGLMLHSSDGRPQRIIGSLLDITAQKQLDTAKDEFISLVSHQLRTPLTVIRVYGEMLTSGQFGNLTAEQTQWVHHMTTSSGRLIDIVGTILNVSRLDLGRIKLAPEPLDMVRLVHFAIQEVEPLAAEKQVQIRLEPSQLPLVPLDETVFVQILHNLLTNAIRYTRPREGRVKVALHQGPDGYVLSVQDNGIGIPKDAREHVFERFYRARNALAVETQGSGLGLYLIKVMCDAYGGKTWFTTATGRGTTFYVQIPLAGMTPVNPSPDLH